jgi:ribonuclease HII
MVSMAKNLSLPMLPVGLHLDVLEAGCDEAGRGCLAGPVCAAAVILPTDFRAAALNDSKKVSKKKRDDLRTIILNHALHYGIAFVSPEEIDEINILNASFLAMHRALDQLAQKPEHILVDGNRFHPYADIPHRTIVKGDGKYMNIAAASILAKTSRDQYMEKMADAYPMYDWTNNKGYPTPKHKQALEQFGPSPLHRKSFKLKEKQLALW